MSSGYLEKDFQHDFRRYAKNRLSERGSFVYELKATKQSYINFGALPKHQEYALRAASEGTAHYKIPDDGFTQRPFDGFQLSSVPAYVGVMFNTNEQQKKFYFLSIEEWVSVRDAAERKSLTEAKSSEVGETHHLA